MQPDVPFQLIRVLAFSRVGLIWAGQDSSGRPLTVATLGESSAADPRWRSAFEWAVRTTTQPNGRPLPVLSADFTAALPWVAVLADGGPGAALVFTTLGVDSSPASAVPTQMTQPASTDDAAPPDAPVMPETATPAQDRVWPTEPNQGQAAWPTFPPSVSSPPAPSDHDATWPISAQPAQPAQSAPPAPPSTAPAPPYGDRPLSSPPVASNPDANWPISAQPSIASPPPYGNRPFSSPPSDPDANWPISAQPALPYFPEPPAPRRRRTGLWVTLAVVILLILGGGGTVVALTVLKDGDHPTATQSSAASSIPTLPTPSPRQPGLEPPRPGDWPRWPTFAAADKVQKRALEGTGLTVTLPANWTCTRAATNQGATRYNCGVKAGNGDELGGEITVRTCAEPCDTERRDAMRKAEEAWGQQWRLAGENAVIAETKTVDGGTRYGLVVIGYWPSTPDQAIDRQIVVRMTAPQSWIDEIRKVANATRDAARF